MLIRNLKINNMVLFRGINKVNKVMLPKKAPIINLRNLLYLFNATLTVNKRRKSRIKFIKKTKSK